MRNGSGPPSYREVLGVVMKDSAGQFVAEVHDKGSVILARGRPWIYVADAINDANRLAGALIPGAAHGAGWRERGVWYRRYGLPFVDPVNERDGLPMEGIGRRPGRPIAKMSDTLREQAFDRIRATLEVKTLLRRRPS